MGLAFFFAGFVLIALPGICARAGRSLRPAEWARTSVSSLVAGWLLIESAALLSSVPSLLALVGDAHVDEVCRRMIDQFAPGGPLVVAPMTLIAIALPVLAIRSFSRMRVARRTIATEAEFGRQSSHVGYDVFTLPLREPLACSVHVDAPRIVISTGTSDCLDDDQLEVVLDHEAAHLDHHHQRYLTVTEILDRTLGRLPFVRNSTAEVRLAVERWADETATGPRSSRRRTLHGALAAVATTMVTVTGVAGLSSFDTLVSRLSALQQPVEDPTFGARAAAHLPVAVTLLATTAAMWMWRRQLFMMVASVAHCLE